MTADVEGKIRDLIVQVSGTAEVLADPDLDLFEAGVMDSMAFVELLFGLEDQLGLAVSPTEVERSEVSSVNRIMEFVKARL